MYNFLEKLIYNYLPNTTINYDLTKKIKKSNEFIVAFNPSSTSKKHSQAKQNYAITIGIHNIYH
jgi:hypothetical protein